MTGFQEVEPEHLAKLFFHYREALAQDFDCVWASGTSSCWEAAPSNERKLLVATARLVLMELTSTVRRNQAAQHASADTNQTGHLRVEGSEGKECGC